MKLRTLKDHESFSHQSSADTSAYCRQISIFTTRSVLFRCILVMRFSGVTDSSLSQVAHFSKYGLQDSDEEEDVPPKTDPKKLKTMMSLPPSRLQQQIPLSQQQVAPQAQVEQPAPINTHHHHPPPH